MKQFLIFLFTILISIPSLESFEISEVSYSKFLDTDEEEKLKALWISYQTKQYNLLKSSLLNMPKATNEEEVKMILRILDLLDEDLESIFPNWYQILDQYINIKRPKENLLQCIHLIKKFKERNLTPALIRLLKYPDFEVRWETIQVLKTIQNDLVYALLFNYLTSKEEILNIYALELSMLLPNQRLLPIIREFLQHPNKIVRIYAYYSLSEFESESFTIIKNLNSEKDESILIAIIDIIGTKKWNTYYHLIHQYITSDNKKIRKASILAAKKAMHPSFANSISRQLLTEKDSEILQEGILALSELRQGDPHHCLVFLLNNENQKIKFLSLKAIQNLKLENQLENLVPFLISEKNQEIHLEITYTIASLINAKNYKALLNSLFSIKEFLSKEEQYLLYSALKNYISESEIFSIKSNLNIVENL